jgi:hypothetical protein
MPAILLSHVLPLAGFYWPNGTQQLLSRMQHDAMIQTALRAELDRMYRPFNRANVTGLVLDSFLSAAYQVQYNPVGDMMFGALDHCLEKSRHEIPWGLAGVGPRLYASFLMALCDARRAALWEKRGETPEGSHARRLAKAVDELITEMQERGWNALEEAWDEDVVEDPRPARPAEREDDEMAQAVQEMEVGEGRPGQMTRSEEANLAEGVQDMEMRVEEEEVVWDGEEQDPGWFDRLYD